MRTTYDGGNTQWKTAVETQQQIIMTYANSNKGETGKSKLTSVFYTNIHKFLRDALSIPRSSLDMAK